MLRSGSSRLYKAVAATAASSLQAAPAISACSFKPDRSRRHLTSHASSPTRRSRQSARFVSTNDPRAAFHSESYFSSAQPESSPTQIGTTPSSLSLDASQTERYLPPWLDVELVAHNTAQQTLFDAIQDLEADLSWQLYSRLGPSRFILPASVIDLLLTLQCHKRMKGLQRDQSSSVLRQVCDRVLRLCQDRARCKLGNSAKVLSSAAAADDGLSSLSVPLSLRILYLLVVEEEQIAASDRSQRRARRPALAHILQKLSANLDAGNTGQPLADNPLDLQLRGRLAATLSRLGSVDAAFHHLQRVAQQASEAEEYPFIDPRPFDQFLAALAKQRSNGATKTKRLPSPIDTAASAVDDRDPILQALRLTLACEVQASKANMHKCLQTLDSSTLWWLLPFELDGSCPGHGTSKQLPDDRYGFKSKWHPWQSPATGLPISHGSLDSLAERLSLVLAQRGILQPALHIFARLQTSRKGTGGSQTLNNESDIPTKVPDHDLFTVVLERLADRMSSANALDARKSLDSHRALSSDAHLAIQIYKIASSLDVDLDPRLNQAVLKCLAACLPSAVVDLGPDRSRLTNFKAPIAKRNEQRGSRETLQNYLRRFTVMLLARDPDLSKGSLSFPGQASLLGLHLRVRDYTFSRRLYQLIRLRHPSRELWSARPPSEPEVASLGTSTLFPLAGPDHATFLWLFSESIRASASRYFALRLYLDWLASGNTSPKELTVIFVQALLRDGHISVVQRVLRELHDERVSLCPRLARSLVISFANAGFPDIAVEMTCTMLHSMAATPKFPVAIGVVGQSPDARQPLPLSATLNFMSVALDRSSRVLMPQDVRLHQKLLRLFDDFRLGLTHHLFGTSAQHSDHHLSSQPQQHVDPQDIRMAYNAGMRVHSLAMMDGVESNTTSTEGESSTRRQDLDGACVVETLFNELVDLGIEPDSDSWTLRLASHVHACLRMPAGPERDHELQTSLDLFESSSQGSRLNPRSDAPRMEAAASTRGKLHQVRLHPGVVSALIDATRHCKELEHGLGVYEAFKRQNGFNASVEQAYLLLLTALAEPNR